MKKVLDTPNAPKAVGTYNQAIESGNLIFTSGQVGIDPIKNTLVEGGVRNEINQVLKNIDSILDDANLNKSHIIKLTVFLTDLNQFEIVNESFKSFFGKIDFPARSTVEVSKLPLGANIEIECIASK
ncbi:MAG: hypothetical protein CBE24_02635 [bacterium TMED264]|nr:MAG: hypothetical protein CBE24_02635 [bacterium TMED264]